MTILLAPGAVTVPSVELATLRRAAVRLADGLTEQWLLADVLADAPEPEVAALARRIGAACADMRALHDRLVALADDADP